MWHKDTGNTLYTIFCEGTLHQMSPSTFSILLNLLLLAFLMPNNWSNWHPLALSPNTARHWDTLLSSLSVQFKLTEAVNLEQESQACKRIRDSLLAGQLSFILCALSDTLPTYPLEPSCWKIQCGAKCSLCGNSQPTVAHILNGCPVALEQGTWRHDCPLSTITSALRCHIPAETTIYADLPNLRATEHPPAQFSHPFWLHLLNQIWSSCTGVQIWPAQQTQSQT